MKQYLGEAMAAAQARSHSPAAAASAAAAPPPNATAPASAPLMSLRVQVSTASVGRFDKMLKGEASRAKGKRKQYETATDEGAASKDSARSQQVYKRMFPETKVRPLHHHRHHTYCRRRRLRRLRLLHRLRLRLHHRARLHQPCCRGLRRWARR